MSIKFGSFFSSSGKSGVPIVSVIIHWLSRFTVLVSFRLEFRYSLMKLTKIWIILSSSVADMKISTVSSSSGCIGCTGLDLVSGLHIGFSWTFPDRFNYFGWKSVDLAGIASGESVLVISDWFSSSLLVLVNIGKSAKFRVDLLQLDCVW